MSFKPSVNYSFNCCKSEIECCIEDIRFRMKNTFRKLNDDKTEYIFLGSNNLVSKFYVDGKVGDNCSGNDTSACGSPSTPYVCKNDYCICEKKLHYQDDGGNCVAYKDPVPPSKVEIVDQTATNLTVTWTKPAEYPGPMVYFIYIFEKERRDSEVADNILYTAPISNNAYNTTKYIHSNRIVGYWTYRAAVRVFLLNDESSNNSYSKQIMTPTAPAGTVHSFRVLIVGFNRSDAKVRWRCLNEKERNGIITNYTVEIKLNGSEDTTFYTIPKDENINKDYYCKYEKRIEIKPGSVYTFTIRANNEDYLGKKFVEEYTAEEATPYLSPLHEAILKYDPVSTTETTVTFQYCSKCLLDESNGAITYSALIICHFKHCNDRRLETIDEQVIRKFITWKQAKEADFNSPFLVTKGDWIKLSNDSEFSTFTAGNEDGCDEKPTEEICNGPLEPGTAYQAIAFSCTSVGCSYTYLGGSGWYRTQDKDRTIPIVAGILGTVAGLILIGVVIVLYKKGKLPCSSKQRPYSVTQTEHVKM
ncbi:hypothetical protein LOTGIDRAFT_232264 [Lottia gigantea]|uniref:Fibronectin type-III domain-containing protein n=1 Tax=Lottia gigantea TaxID=225164 RepID=V4AD91_LOTGI|nr:hypothetical protein LOTGIDRAFT_232264 [Lottia gigantea]ESO94822.1 hypothetical protein LOTGIDRAFT_232264 [Lottia gigantea]